jgi:trans-aconitate methyltransferase
MTSAGHWDEVFAQGDEQRSWYESEPTRSLNAITANATRAAPIIDVGGGSSHLAAALLRAGFTDITVLDLSATGLELARQRLGPDAGHIHRITADLLDWTPQRQFAIWHDRALLHFFTDPAERNTYAQKVRDALDPGGHAIITTFAPDGPDHCSGQPVHRSSASDILNTLGDEFELVEAARSTHLTPAQVPQAFTHVTARRQP